ASAERAPLKVPVGSPAVSARADGDLPQARRQPHGRLSPNGGADSDLLCTLPDAPVLGGAAGGAIRPVDRGPVEEGSLLRAANPDGHLDAGPAEDDSDGPGSSAGSDHAHHAGRFHLYVPRVSHGIGTLLAGEQLPVYSPAISDRSTCIVGEGSRTLEYGSGAVMVATGPPPGKRTPQNLDRTLEQAAHALGLNLPREFTFRTQAYLDELERWQRIGSLTAYRDRAARVQHLVL